LPGGIDGCRRHRPLPSAHRGNCAGNGAQPLAEEWRVRVQVAFVRDRRYNRIVTKNLPAGSMALPPILDDGINPASGVHLFA
jgi:hypothetical protein